MTPETWERLRPLFHAALDLPPEQRHAFVVSSPVPEDLRGPLRALLDLHETGIDTFEQAVDTFKKALDEEARCYRPGDLILGRFRIIRSLGVGGMGEVYEVNDSETGRIALKTIRAGLAENRQMLARFRQEVNLARKVNGPNVCRIHELFHDPPKRTYFLTMEFLEGPTLADRVDDEGPLPLDEAERIARQLCAGLSAIHEAGIVHRDFKTRNVMLSERNGRPQAVITDFGLARDGVPGRESDDSAMTQPGTVMGTPEYMAPEQFEGRTATAAADIYALGVVLYKMVTGKTPFTASSLLGAAIQRARQPPSASSLRRGLPKRWDTVICRCLEYEPERRFQSASEVAECLFGGSFHLSGLAGRRSRFQKPLPAIVLTAAALVAVLAVWGAWSRHLFSSRPAAVAPAPQILVVLPFDNLGGDPAGQQLCDGLQETVTGILSRAVAAGNGMLIVPSSEVRRNQVRTIGDARKQFYATLALTGSIQKNTGGLEVMLNLADAASLRQRDSRAVSIAPGEAASLPAKLAAQLASMLGPEAAPRAESNTAAAPTSNSRAYDLYLRGTGALENRASAQAVDLLRQVVEADPRFYLARSKLALAYLQRNNETKDPKWLSMADAEVSQAARGGDTPEILLAQAAIRAATGDAASAIALFRRVIQSDPANIQAYLSLAETLDSSGDPVRAEDTYNQAVRLRPGYWPIYGALGLLYYHQKQYGKAEQAFLKGIGLSPDAAGLHRNLGSVYFEMGRWEEAGAAFEKSAELKPNALAYSNLGTVRFFRGDYAGAAKQAGLAVKLQPANPVNWGNLGDARWQIPGGREAARQAFAQAVLLAGEQLALTPGNVRLRKSYALYLAKVGRTKEAVAEIERSLAAAPKDQNVQFFAARVYAVTGDLPKALFALKRASALGYSSKEIAVEPDFNVLRDRKLL